MFHFLPFPDGPFDLTQPLSVLGQPGTPPPSLDFLLPGTGTLFLDFGAPCICLPGEDPPEVALLFSEVELIVSGTPIPEPASLQMLGLALSALVLARQWIS